jgi:hypothetical protein
VAMILEFETLDLGPDVRAIGMELVEPGATREPVRGAEAAKVWSRVLPAVAAGEPLVFDFFSHLERVRDFCVRRNLAWREGAENYVAVSTPSRELMAELLERFERETSGARAGRRVDQGDPELEEELSKRGADAYDAVYSNYTFCAILSLDEASVTLLAPQLCASEVVQLVRPALNGLDVQLSQPV